LIKRGETTLDELLTWFGPPDYIIDGKQKLVDYVSVFAGYCVAGPAPYAAMGDRITNRVLEAREGEVILVYLYVRMEVDVSISSGYASTGRYGGKVRAQELQIHVSKTERTVTDFAFKELS
jgi:hypothetical protein